MGKTAFLFSGQGAQRVGMGKSLYDAHASVRAIYARANDILGYDLATLCFEGPVEQLDTTAVSQPAIFVTCFAGLEIVKQLHPDWLEACGATAGLSLGEYTALVFAEAMTFEDGLRLVQLRGRAMQEASDAIPSGMVRIRGIADIDVIKKLCDENRGDGLLQIANYLAPEITIVSGTREACERIADAAKPAGAREVMPLPVAGAFHTPLMKPADEKLAAALEDVAVSPPKIPVYSNVDAVPHQDPDDIRRVLVDQLISPVLMDKAILNMVADGFDTFHEIGTDRTFRALVKRISRGAQCDGIDM